MFAVLVKLKWFFKVQWRRYALAIFLLFVVNILDIIPPRLIGVAIDEIYLGSLTMERLMQFVLIFIGIIISLYVLSYIWMYQLFGGSILIARILRSKFMGHLLKMTPTFFEKNRTGDLMARATNDLQAISVTAGFGILTLVDSSMYLLVILFTMGILISWKLTFAALIPLPIMAIIMKYYGKIIHERFTTAQDAFGDMNDQVLETIAGIRVIRAYVQEKATEERFSAITEDVYQKNIAVAKIDSLFDPTIKILVGISYLIGLGYGAYLVFDSVITLGQLVSFNVYLGMLIWPMFAIGELINIMQRGNASLDRVNETLAYHPDVEDASVTVSLEQPNQLGFEKVIFQYPTSVVNNLEGINFRLYQGQTLGIVGRTGSGKTTLIKQFLREYPLGEGRVTMNESSLDQMKVDDVRRWIGYVPQEAILFSKTVRENILFGNKHANEEKLSEVLELAAFRKDIEFLPDGLETLVGEKGVALSGGQKQRLSIARALIADPEILILDDSLSAVDAKTEAEIIENIRRERAGKTTFITTHRLSAVQHADWILVLDQGRIVEEGTHEDLLSLGGWYKEQYERQQIEANLSETG